MAPRRMRRGVRAILAGGMLAIGSFAVTGADAAVPVLHATSVESGWSQFNQGVAADFDEPMATTSTATMRVVTGSVPVPGTTSVINNNGILFAPSSTLVEDGTLYEVTFNPISAIDEAPGAAVVRQFKVDTKVPRVQILTPSALVSSEELVPGLRDGLAEFTGSIDDRIPGIGPEVAIAAPGTGTTFTGIAQDSRGELETTKATSGIARVHLRFYEVLPTGESTESRIVINVTCGTGQCPADVNPWEASSQTLTPGFWTVRAVAFDLAGNASAPSGPISFLKLA